MEFCKRLIPLFAIVCIFSGTTQANSFNDWLLGPQAQASVSTLETSGLDKQSADCMQCHNGAKASHVKVKTANSAMHFARSGRQTNHPVGMNYSQHAGRSPGDFRNPDLLESTIKLVDGQVACVSCHLPKKDEHVLASRAGSVVVPGQGGNIQESVAVDNCTSSKDLTVGPRKTDLCLACHVM